MQRWLPRTLTAMLVSVAVPAGLFAQQPAPMPVAGAPVPTPVYVGNPYQAATPYSPTVVGQAIPNPQLNRANYTLPCANPNQNFEPYAPTRPEGLHRIFGRSGCSSCGDPSGSGWLHGSGGSCSKGGSCTTCCNTGNFAFGTSRSFFGESSRDFFERPAALDGLKTCPNKWAPGTTVPVGGTVIDP